MENQNLPLDLILGLISNEWIHLKPTAADTKAIDQFNLFRQEIAPSIAILSNSKEEAIKIIGDVMGKITFQTKTLTFRDMGYSSNGYDNHGYPTAYDMDDSVSGISPLLESIDTTEAMTFLNDLKKS